MQCKVIALLLCFVTLATAITNIPIQKLASSQPVHDIGPSRKRYDPVPVLNNHLQFVVPVSIGTPADTYQLHIDTGSVLTAVFISGCTTCDTDSPDPHYSPYLSNTSSLIGCTDAICTAKTCYTGSQSTGSGCGFQVQYGLGNIDGEIYTDMFKMGDYTTEVLFGAIYTSSKDFEAPGADGILGLAYNNPSVTCRPNCIEPIYDKLVTANADLSDIFSLHITDTGGWLTLGGYDPVLTSGLVLYTPVVQKSLYYIKMNSMSLGGYTLTNTPSAPIVDSGTSLILLPNVIYNQFKSILQTKYKDIPYITGSTTIFEYCLNTDWYVQNVNKMPSMTFVFDGVEITIPSSSYLISRISNGKVYYCLEVAGSADQEFAILGYPLFLSNTIIFDRVNNTVGFAAGAGSQTKVEIPHTTSSTSSSSSSTAVSSYVVPHLSILVCVLCVILNFM